MKSTLFVFLSAILLAGAAKAAPVHGFTPAQIKEMAALNEKQASEDFVKILLGQLTYLEADVTRLPVAEYANAGYLLFNDLENFNSKVAKRGMAENLPEGVTLVVYTTQADKAYQQTLFNKYAQMIDKKRLKVIYLPSSGNGFWARNGVPVPVWDTAIDGTQKFGVVDARYYHQFEADAEIGAFFGAQVIKHEYYYEGGNFMANGKGDCLMINTTNAAKIPLEVFEGKYGCKRTIRLPYLKGIGHADESVKFIDDDTIVTDSEQYKQTLQAAGFDVVMIPRPNNPYETYVNSLLVNGTLFLPVFGQEGDAKATAVYESLGLKVVPLESKSLSNYGKGSIHCITMTYPPVEFNKLLEHLGAEEL